MMKNPNQTRVSVLLVLFTLLVSNASALCGEAAPVFEERFIYEPGSVSYPSCHASTIEDLGEGVLVAAWYGGTAEKDKDVAIYGAQFDPVKKEWSESWLMQDTPNLSEGNPVLFLAPDGKLWLYFTTIMKENWPDARMFYKYSEDGGRTWSEPEVLIERLGWMTRNKPIILKNGWLLLPIYDEIVYNSAFFISPDGHKWKKSALITCPGGCIQASVVQRADGTLLTGMRTGSDNGLLWWAESDSNGRKWDKPYTNEIKNPGSGADMVMLASGNIALAYNDSSKSRNPMNIAISEDGGKTWPYNKIIQTDDIGASYSYPAIIQDSNGLIHVTFTYRRETIKHITVNEEWVINE